MKQMPNVWLDTLINFDDIVTHIEGCLDTLKANAVNADFYQKPVREQFKNDVIFMKQFFEKAELLSRASK